MFGRRRSRTSGAVAERNPAVVDAERLVADGRMADAIDFLSAANRLARSTEIEIEIRRLRGVLGVDLLADPPADPAYVDPSAEIPPLGPETRIPETGPEGLSAAVVRGALLQSGCLLVRGLMDPEKATLMAADIDRSFELRARLEGGGTDPDGFYDELEPEHPFQIVARDWIRRGGGVLAVDSPRLLFDMLEAFEEAGLRDVIESYLGEPPAISAQKCTLRKATPDVSGGWHQDGKFLGDVRSLNVWLSLSRCGDVAPSMDVVPTRLEEYVPTGGEGTVIEAQIGEKDAAAAAEGVGVVRPIFDPGDALIFDHLFLHKTGSDPTMPNARYAIESWFFGPSAFPEHYVPIAF